MESWDDENFEPPVVAPAVTKLNKWQGEDEEEDVKESWEDEEEDRKEAEKPVTSEAKKSKKKSLAEKIAEKERLRKEELEKKLRDQDEREITEEEKLRMQKESDLKLALETTFGHDEDREIAGLKLPVTKEDYEEFAEQLSKQLTPLASSPEYVDFTESLTRNLCATMASVDIKKIKNALDNLYLEKQKIEKGDKAKKNKGKGKARLKVEGDALSAYTAEGGYTNDYDEFDDFI